MKIVVLKKSSLILIIATLLPVLGFWAVGDRDIVWLVVANGYKTVRQITEDTNNDAIKETIKVRADVRKRAYWVEIIHRQGKTYTLKPNPKIGLLGVYEKWYPLNIIVLDINRDGKTEILVLGTQSHEKPFHVYRWNGNKYELLFSRMVTGLDFHDVNGDRVPELIAIQRIYGSGFEYVAYEWQDNHYRAINYSMEAGARGFTEITVLLEYLDRPFGGEITFPRELEEALFTQRWNRNTLNRKRLLKKFENTVSVQILSYIGEDLKWGRYNLPEQSTWKFQLLLFHKQGVQLRHELAEVEFRTNLVDPRTAAYRIDSIRFR